MSDHTFCRLYLKETRASLTNEQRRQLVGGWSYVYRWSGVVDSGEFHVPRDSFYWHGSACCAYSARAAGIHAWLQQNYPEQQAA